LLPAVAAAAALALSACGGSSGGDNPTLTQPSGSAAGNPLAAKVPDAIKADGKIVVGTDSTYAPAEFLAADGKTIQGFDVDLFNAVAKQLGLKAEFVTASFDAIIPGVGSGKYEIGVSSFTINPERTKVVDMISYFQAGTQWGAKAGASIDPDNACGKKVAVQKATVQVTDLEARSKKCVAAGKPKITIDQYQDQGVATSAVLSGKEDAMLADSPVIAYAVKQTNGKLALVGNIYDSAPYGFVIKKGDTAFADVLVEALKAAIADGSYKTALSKWGGEQGGITDPKVNP
jgi:polar amino acid transport system substrate-binding protein